MGTFIVRRLLYSIPVLLITSFLIFMFVSASGDPLSVLRQVPNLNENAVNSIIEAKHLDEPLLVQYVYWVKDAVTNGFGTTLLSDQKIWPDLQRVLGNTVQLVVMASIFAVAFGIIIGVLSAVRQYSVFDYSATTFSFVAFSMPVFWVALIFQIAFTNLYLSTGVRFFYTAGLSSPNPEYFWLDRIQHLALPVLTLALLSIAQYSRFMRASMLEVINSDYVRTARAKGLKERRVIMKHGFRNALIPLVTQVAIDFGAIFGGAILTESVFGLDGMGLYFVRNLGDRDVYPIMAWLMITSVLVIFFNLLADILYGWLDPRIRYD